MGDNYQPIYDAIRSRVGHADIGSAVENVMHSLNIGQYFQNALGDISYQMTRPCVVFKPTLELDVTTGMWFAVYDRIQMGVGESPELAMQAFDRKWTEVKK